MQIGIIGLGRMGAGMAAEVWRRGSVITSWLLDLGAAALANDPQLTQFSGRVEVYARFRSRREHTFGEKMLSAMRLGFGGHIEEAANT